VFVTGLTGGIATGKSTVAGIFRQAGATIIDADEIAHAVVRQGQSAWEKIVAHFGEKILLPDGEINRVRLGDIIFKDIQQKDVLNRIVHPEVFREMARQVDAAAVAEPGGVIIMDVPLLIESGMHTTMPEVILVYTPEAIQIRRLMQRDGLGEVDARARVDSQMPIEEKRAKSSIIIDNSADLNTTRIRTMDVYQYLKDKIRLKKSGTT
jgi:dephospho-CoA kinase